MSFREFPGPLFTDLYELTMAAGYYDRRLDETATFSLFVRDHPQRGYFVAAGLQSVVDALTRFRFSDEEMDWLAHTGRPGFLPCGVPEPLVTFATSTRAPHDWAACRQGMLGSRPHSPTFSSPNLSKAVAAWVRAVVHALSCGPAGV